MTRRDAESARWLIAARARACNRLRSTHRRARAGEVSAAEPAPGVAYNAVAAGLARLQPRCTLVKDMPRDYPTLADSIGNTPLVRLQRLPGSSSNILLAKLEGSNPAGSVKDRPALSMFIEAEKRGEIHPGDTLIEPTSGNTGIELAMVAAMRGYRMVLVMPDNLSVERRVAMTAYGAELVLTPQAGGMEGARDRADAMVREGRGRMLDQFANP